MCACACACFVKFPRWLPSCIARLAELAVQYYAARACCALLTQHAHTHHTRTHARIHIHIHPFRLALHFVSSLFSLAVCLSLCQPLSHSYVLTLHASSFAPAVNRMRTLYDETLKAFLHLVNKLDLSTHTPGDEDDESVQAVAAAAAGNSVVELGVGACERVAALHNISHDREGQEAVKPPPSCGFSLVSIGITHHTSLTF